jgi:hypothetical protein
LWRWELTPRVFQRPAKGGSVAREGGGRKLADRVSIGRRPSGARQRQHDAGRNRQRRWMIGDHRPHDPRVDHRRGAHRKAFELGVVRFQGLVQGPLQQLSVVVRCMVRLPRVDHLFERSHERLASVLLERVCGRGFDRRGYEEDEDDDGTHAGRVRSKSRTSRCVLHFFDLDPAGGHPVVARIQPGLRNCWRDQRVVCGTERRPRSTCVQRQTAWERITSTRTIITIVSVVFRYPWNR